MAAENGEETSEGATPTWADVLTDGLLAGGAGVWRWEVGTDELVWSGNMEAIHSLPPGSFDRTFNSFAGTIHPDDGERVLDAFRKVVSDGEHYAVQYRLAADPAAATRWIEARGQVIRDPQGRAVRVTGISQDITAHKNAEAELALRARQQEAVAQLGERALAGAAQNEIFAEAARTVAELAEAEFAEILELSQERDTLTLRVGHGWGDGAAGQAVATSDPDTQIGMTLRSRLPVIVADFSTERRFKRPERLTVQGVESAASVVIAGSEGIPFGALAIYCRRTRAITPTDVRFLQSVANVLGSAIRATQDQERRELLISELRHRVGNLFSLVQALHRQTGQSAHDAHDLEMKFGARLAALATAHSLILDTGWQKTSLRSLLQTTLAPYIDRVEFNGTDVRMPADAAFSFSMALHELATNANKYGALSVPEGRLSIEIRSAPDALGQKLVLVWKEQDGPPPPTEESEGFGSRLITQVVERQLSGQVARILEPDGLRIVVEFPIA